MARHFLSEPRVKNISDSLNELFLSQGSVRAVHRMLYDSLEKNGHVEAAKELHLNKIFSLLSGEPNKAVNTRSLEVIELALSHLHPIVKSGESDKIISLILQSASLEKEANPDQLVREVAKNSGFPIYVVKKILENKSEENARINHHPILTSIKRIEPDWSFQDEAVKACMNALQKNPNSKVGLIIPTGGGKTRIAMKILLQWLAAAERQDTKIIWITHRQHLKRQARRELQKCLNDENNKLPTTAMSLLERRVEFVMLNELSQILDANNDSIELIVVDEAHHAAAASYQPLFIEKQLKGLFLTATPNRADELPIGIDTIAYSITYRELFERGVIIEPTFHNPIYVPNWADEGEIRDLVDLILERTEVDFQKLLIAVSKREYAESLYNLLLEKLEVADSHPLSIENIMYVHGSGSSVGDSAEEALDEFSAFPRGILIATGQLVGEGFDDPSIDSIIVTYPSSSMSHLMQLVGRVIRFAPNKRSAHVIQSRQTELGYYFEQGWLYQDISDSLRPRLKDYNYNSYIDLHEKFLSILNKRNVQEETTQRIIKELSDIHIGEKYHLLLAGRPYYETAADFETNSAWEAILIKPDTRPSFLTLFNYYSDIGVKHDTFEQGIFLSEHVELSSKKGSKWKSHMDMLFAMRWANHEIRHIPYPGEGYRGYESMPQPGTTWLTYVTFTYKADLSEDFEFFLFDVVNKNEVSSLFLSDKDKWKCAIKVPLPLSGTYAFLLNVTQYDWLIEQRIILIDKLSKQRPEEGFSIVEQWLNTLKDIPLPYMVIKNIACFINETTLKEHCFKF